MYGISDLTKLAIFTLQFACALIGALIVVQLGVLASDVNVWSNANRSSAPREMGSWPQLSADHANLGLKLRASFC
jgi:hypothetical protein